MMEFYKFFSFLDRISLENRDFIPAELGTIIIKRIVDDHTGLSKSIDSLA